MGTRRSLERPADRADAARPDRRRLVERRAPRPGVLPAAQPAERMAARAADSLGAADRATRWFQSRLGDAPGADCGVEQSRSTKPQPPTSNEFPSHKELRLRTGDSL